MDIWHIIPSTNHGGHETFARSLISNYPEKIKHTVFSTSNIDGIMSNDFCLISELKKLSVHKNFKTIFNYFRLFIKKRPKAIIIHTFNTSLFSFILISRLFMVKKVIITVGNPPPKKYIFQIKIYIKILKYLGIPLIFCSEYILNEYKNISKLPNKSINIRHGCDLNEVNLNQEKVNNINLEKKFFTITMVARLDFIKDHETLIRSFLDINYKNWRLNLVGDGIAMKYLKDLVDLLDGNQKVKFLGSRNDIKDLLKETDIFAFSTTAEEGFGIALIEALSVGCPIIASDVPACNEVLINGSGGILVSPGDLNNWKENLKEIMDSEDKRKFLSKKAFEISKFYDIKFISKKYRDFISAI